ncbi:hypothetical protein [Clostridium polynesiense]|uniref:hypothetical protein n=1 Tax=Clostridium polynesiense TaxID=1325933 RepID=UPI00058B701A|nr:hypothetical protein [Clostridium polynesiense]
MECYFLCTLKKGSIKIEKILKWISVSVFITCSFALVEFAARNLFPSLLSVFNLLGIDTVLKYDALYFEVYQRSRAFMTESGHYAMFVNAFLPISLYYIYRYKGIAAFLIYFIICSLGYLVSFSAGAFASLAAAFLAAFLFYTIEKHSKKSILLFSTALIFVMIVFYYIKDISFFQGIMEKVLFVNDSGRLWRWQFSLDSFLNADFFQMIFGRGLGFLSYTYSTGSTNWFIEATVETGLLGIITIILILLISIKRILQMKYEFKYFIFIGITAMIIQYNLISDYWYPWIWTTIALSSYFRYLEKKAGEEK